ncbi:hypothetical protein [Streptomyces koelreuteriae]|uniref:hypothetical protein n=1 Tax=Streptomyces koelreuteriae TaxID=2838015 RepID=UPI003EC0B4B8
MRSHSITQEITQGASRRSLLGAALSAGAAIATVGGLTGCGVSRRRDELFLGFHGDTVWIGAFQEIVRLYGRKYPRESSAPPSTPTTHRRLSCLQQE